MTPWTCCGSEEILDSEACSTCGSAKRAWTLRHGVTRKFVVGRSMNGLLAPPVPVQLQFLYQVAGESPRFMEGVEVIVPEAVVEERPEPAGETGTVLVPFHEPGTYEIKLKLPEPFNEEWLTCDPNRFVTRDGVALGGEPVRVTVGEQGGETVLFRVEASYVRIRLLDPDGNPVAGEPYLIQVPQGRTDKLLKGKLDDAGEAKELVPGPWGSEAKVSFPHWYEHDFVDEPQIKIELRDPSGRVVAGEPFVVESSDGSVLEKGELDEAGVASVKAPHGKYRLIFPNWYAHDFAGREA